VAANGQGLLAGLVTVGLSAVLVFIECPARNRSRFEKLKLKLTTKS
jgi:hypothetical protein